MMSLLNIFRNKLPKEKVIWCIGVPYTKEQFASCCSMDRDSDFIESLEFKFGTNDKEILWNRYQSTANKIWNCINSLTKKGVTILSVSSQKDLENVFNHSVVIIMAHRHRFLNCFDFMGNKIPFDDVADIIPRDYNGIVDVSSCHSASFQMQWKKKRINARYIAANTESSIELRLFIYEHAIRYMISHPNKSYLQSLEVILERIKSGANENVNMRDDVLLGGKVAAKKQGAHSASVFAPSEIIKGDDMMIQVYLYEDKDHNNVVVSASGSDEGTIERSQIPLNFNLEIGDNVKIHFNLLHVPEAAQVKSFVWQGKATKCFFNVTIPSDYDKKKCFVEIFLSVNEVPLGEMSFTTKIVEEYSSEKIATNIFPKQFKKVFISYSHADIDNVQFVATAYKALGVNYFFDSDNLVGGDVYEEKIMNNIDSSDLFILCWSANAAKSDFIPKEIDRALIRAYPQKSHEEATIKIYPISIEPHATLPDVMAKKYHFDILG